MPMGPRSIRPKLTTLNGIQDQSDSRLLGLPADVRTIIFEYSLAETCEIPNAGAKGNRSGSYPSPGLLFACKQIYAEGINIYYHETAFEFGCRSRMMSWLQHIASKNGRGPVLRSVMLRAPPMTSPEGMVSQSSPRQQSWTFVNLREDPIVKRAKIKSGVLKLEFQPCHWRRKGFKSWGPELLGASQTWALTWDDSSEAQMVQC